MTSNSSSSMPWLQSYPRDVDWHASFTPAPLFSVCLMTAVAKYGSNAVHQFPR